MISDARDERGGKFILHTRDDLNRFFTAGARGMTEPWKPKHKYCNYLPTAGRQEKEKDGIKRKRFLLIPGIPCCKWEDKDVASPAEVPIPLERRRASGIKRYSFCAVSQRIRAYGGCLGIVWRWRTWRDCDKRRGGVEQPLIRRCPNGETFFGKTEKSRLVGMRTRWSETSQ